MHGTAGSGLPKIGNDARSRVDEAARVGHVVDNLEMLTIPTPRPSLGDVAIKVVTSSLHIDEINATQGTALGRFYAPKHMSREHPHIMGSAVSGIVVGSGVQTEFMLRHGAAVFDCVGGREIERDGFRALNDRGVFVTVVGPMKYLGETKLSRLQTAQVIGHVLRRIVTTRFRAKRYIFGEKPPRRVIDEALARSIRHDIHMPVADVISFDLDAIRGAVDAVVGHSAKGRIVIACE
jgi:NADPH:quinone reductase-like Zn-dependent oxidoreductase